MASSPATPLRVERSIDTTGLTVVAHRSPAAAASFSATYVGPGGWAYDPPGRGGLSLVASQLAASAAGRHDRVALARLLDSLGATLGHGCAPESTELSVWGPASAFEPLLELLADAVLRPRFDTPDLERVLRQLKERQLRERTQPDSRADNALLQAIFPAGHPYRESGLGDARSARRLNRTELRRFHRDHYTSEGGFLVVTGPWPLPIVERAVRHRFRDWAVERAPPTPAVPRVVPTARPLETIPMPGRAQVEIRFGGPSIARSDPRYPAAFLANEVLGGRGLLARLFQRVRSKAGLAYHASSDLEAMRWGGYWQAQAGTGPERVGPASRLVRDELRRLGDELIPSAELDRIRESAIGELPLALETTSGSHQLAVDIAYHGLPDDFLERWPTSLRQVTPRSLRETIPDALDGRRAVALLVGPVPRAKSAAK